MRAALRDKRQEAARARAASADALGRPDSSGPLRVNERLHAPVPGGVIRTLDGSLYGVALDGSIHVARDAEGRKLRPPKARRSPYLEPADPVAPEPGAGNSTVAAPLPIVDPGAT